MPRPARNAEIDAALLGEASAHPHDLVRIVASGLGLSRAAVAQRAKALIDAGYLAKSGTTRPTYALGPHRRRTAVHALAAVTEDLVWARDVAPALAGLPPNVIDLCHYGLTEMVNNAVDHSEGRALQVLVDRRADHVTLLVGDDGVGIFRKIARALELYDDRLALLELSKGKLTTDPRRHSGEGVFFTSRMFDRFRIVSGPLAFDHDGAGADLLLDVDRSDTGTLVLMEIAADSPRTAKEIFDAYSSGPDDYTFAKTVVPVRLARIGDENLVSRSQAKRLLQRVDRFRTVVLDFDGVASIGQAFADEIFRVFANDYPHVELVPVHVQPDVQTMIRRAETLRAETPLPLQ